MAGAKIPQDWDGETWECWAVEWPGSKDWLAILQGFLSTPRLGRYWDGETGSITGVQVTGREIADRNKILKECLMACSDEVLDILREMVAKMSGNGCCGGIEGATGGSSGAGMESSPPSGISSGETEREGPPPTGFDSWEEFDDYRCNWASYIIDQIRVDVATMGSMTIGAEAATALAGILVTLLLTPVGWVVLLQIAAIMIAASITAGFYGWIDTHLVTYKEEYVCALLSGSDTGSSVTNLHSAIDAKIPLDTAFNLLTGYWANDILTGLASTDSINRMYNKQSFVPPVADCSACLGEILAYVNNVPCAPVTDPIEGHFFDNEPVEVEACEGGIFGDTRTQLTVISNPPASNIDRKITIISASGLANYYLQPYYEGVAGAGIGLSAASMAGYEIECSILIITTPAVNDTSPFTVTLKAEPLP